MLRKINITGGVLTKTDFGNYKVIVQPALQGSYKNRTVYTSHAPTSGPVLLFMLNLHEQFDKTTDNTLSLHRYVETLKCKYAFSFMQLLYTCTHIKMSLSVKSVLLLGENFFTIGCSF